MRLYLRTLRATEGNKNLARELVKAIKRRDRFSALYFKTEIKPILDRMRAEIAERISAMGEDYFQVVNLRAINRGLAQSIASMEAQFEAALTRGQAGAMELSVEELRKQFRSAGLGELNSHFIVEDALGGISPLTQVITDNFAAALAKKINSEVAFSLTNGEGAFKLAARLEETLGMSTAQADRIAITEINRAYSTAQQMRGEEMAEANPALRKIWISSHKPNAREDHLEVEAESMKNPLEIDDDFDVGGEPALQPHDPRLSAGQSVNCGCAVVFINAEDRDAMVPILKKNIEEATS